MRKSFKFFTVLFMASVLVLVFSIRAFSQESSESGEVPVMGPSTAPSWGPDQSVEPKNFGTLDGIDHWIPASEFQPRSSGTGYGYAGLGYIYRSSGTDFFWAPVNLPNGALVNGVRLYYYDNSASNITMWFTRYYGDTSPSLEGIGSFTSTGTPGNTSDYMTLNHTIDLRDPSGNATHYVIVINPATTDSSIRFKGVRVFWHRQVSPAPGTATFGDVPTSHPFFQYIEALVDSGITAGCGGGNYCPNDPLTRGQMAVFLSKALGLHWPW